jgi:hypothetical protein
MCNPTVFGRASEITLAMIDGQILDGFVAIPSEQPMYLDGLQPYFGDKRPV